MFAREWVSDLRRARERFPDLPEVVLVHQGTPEEGDAVLGDLWPGAPAVADPERVLFAGFGLGRGRFAEILGPRTWLAGLRAILKGHFVGRPVGDPLVMPGLFLVEGTRVLWRHEFTHVGDQPSADELVAATRAALGERVATDVA